METAAARRQFFRSRATRVGEFWLDYIDHHQANAGALSGERENILQAIATCQIYGIWQVAADLALRFHRHMIYTGLWTLWARCLSDLLDRRQDALGVTEARLQRCLAEVLSRQRKWAESVRWSEQAVAALRKAGEAQHLARCLDDLAHGYFYLNRWPEAERAAAEMQAIAETLEFGAMRADAFILMGRMCQEDGRLGEAIRHYKSALETADRARVKSATNFLAMAYLSQDRPDEALLHLWPALEIAREEGDLPGQAVILGNVGTAYLALRQLDLASQYLGQSLEIARTIDNRPEQARILLRLGRVSSTLEETEQALRYFDHALELAREAGDSKRTAEILQAIGGIH